MLGKELLLTHLKRVSKRSYGLITKKYVFYHLVFYSIQID